MALGLVPADSSLVPNLREFHISEILRYGKRNLGDTATLGLLGTCRFSDYSNPSADQLQKEKSSRDEQQRLR